MDRNEQMTICEKYTIKYKNQIVLYTVYLKFRKSSSDVN